MNQNQGLYSLLYHQAQLIFANEKPIQLSTGQLYYHFTPTIATNISLAQFYILLNAYFLKKPKNLLAFLEDKNQTIFNLEIYLQSLKSFSNICIGSTQFYSYLKQIYILISSLEEVRVRLKSDCSIPENIYRALFTLSSVLQENKSNLIEWKPTSQDKTIAQSNILIMMTNLSEKTQQSELDQLCVRLRQLVKKYELSILRIFDMVMNNKQVLSNRHIFLHFYNKYFKKNLIEDNIINYLLDKLSNQYYSKGDRLQFRNKLNQLYTGIQSYSQPPNQSTIKIVCILIQQSIIEYDKIFPILTPSIQFLQQYSEVHSELHQQCIKNCFSTSLQESDEFGLIQCIWGELIYSSKLQLLNQMVLMNQFNIFKQIIDKYSIKLDMIYHPRIYHSLSLLIEWMVDHLYQKISYSIYFSKSKRKQILFPKGFFSQHKQINNEFMQNFGIILSVGKSYLFAKRQTLIKICRIFKDISSKNVKIPFDLSISKKIELFTSDLIKKYLLPSIQFYRADAVISFEIQSLMDCFRFKFQYQIFTYCIKNQLSNFHLAVIYKKASDEQSKLLNRLSINSQIIMHNMSKLMYCNIFSALGLFFRRIHVNQSQYMNSVIDKLLNTPKLTQKMALHYIFYHMQQQVCIDEGRKLVSSKYNCLINFTKRILLMNKQQDYTKIIIQYILYRFTYCNPIFDITVFAHLYREIIMLSDLVGDLLPIDIDQSYIYNNKLCLTAGPLLKIYANNNIEQFYLKRHLRRHLVKTMFIKTSKVIFDSYFYYILLKLNEKLSLVGNKYEGQFQTASYYYNQITILIINLIDLASFELSSNQLEIYFDIKLFKPLSTYYMIPFQICFYIIRKSIWIKMVSQNYSWIDEHNWAKIKEDLIESIKKSVKQNSGQRGLFFRKYNEEEVNVFLSQNIFLLFWLQQPEYTFYHPQQYTHSLKNLELSKKGDSVSAKQLNQSKFYQLLMNENKKIEKINHLLKVQQIEKGSIPKMSYYQKLKINLDEQTNRQQLMIYYCEMLIKYCIFPRALLTKSQCYYSWYFYYYFLNHNNFSISEKFKLICLLLDNVWSYIPFASYREATQLLPLMYNSASTLFKWDNFNDISQKLYGLGFTKQKITMSQFISISATLLDFETKIFQMLMNMYKLDIFSIKNFLHMIYSCTMIPLYQESSHLIIEALAIVNSNYADNQDLTKMVARIQSEVYARILNAKKIVKQEIKQFMDQYKLVKHPATGENINYQHINQKISPQNLMINSKLSNEDSIQNMIRSNYLKKQSELEIKDNSISRKTDNRIPIEINVFESSVCSQKKSKIKLKSKQRKSKNKQPLLSETQISNKK